LVIGAFLFLFSFLILFDSLPLLWKPPGVGWKKLGPEIRDEEAKKTLASDEERNGKEREKTRCHWDAPMAKRPTAMVVRHHPINSLLLLLPLTSPEKNKK
jgi:hypothetical protein